jgi:mono/diheme cytochrome c family protein
MKKFFKWLGIVLGVLIGLIVLVVAGFYLNANAKLNRTYSVPDDNLTIPTDTASIARGEHIAKSLCIGCHGDNLAGKVFMDSPAIAIVDSANLTSGKGGLGTKYSDQDFVRALRHGVRKDGKSVFIMPSNEFWNMSDADLGSLVAYIKALPAVDNQPRDMKAGLMGHILLGAGILAPSVLPAQVIAQDKRPDFFPAPGVTTDYGQYLVNISGCRSCHGEHLSGGKSSEPSAIGAPNLTPGGEVKYWSDTDFMKTVRNGVTPGGHKLDPVQMPWEHYRNFSDDEIKAIYLYLQSQPALASTTPK